MLTRIQHDYGDILFGFFSCYRKTQNFLFRNQKLHYFIKTFKKLNRNETKMHKELR